MNLRSFLACILLLTITGSVLAAPNPRYRPVLKRFKAQTRIPLLLPAWLPRDTVGQRFAQATATAHSYSAELAYAADCNGTEACTGTTLRGEDIVAAARNARALSEGGPRQTTAQYLQWMYRSGRRVRITHAVVGWYMAPGLSADGGDTTLTWYYKSAYYSLTMRSSVPATVMIRCAASALP